MAGGFFGAATFDGAHLFSATAIGDFNPPSLSVCDPSNPRDTPIQEPSLHAFTAASGAVRWEQTANQSFAPTSLAAGVVLSSSVGLLTLLALHAYDARTGQLLARFPLPGSGNSGATPVGKMIFIGSGNSSDGTGGAVQAFTLP